jgi:hypothetical protein
VRPAVTIAALGFAVALAGDACHGAAGATRYEWEGEPATVSVVLCGAIAVASGLWAALK